ncbi:phage major capsid protein [Fulvivirga sedimenti]|uniref:Phage major capsid protein n=1 Tax=Fulvivirga sedimenti TaxID=2879465 RepID=A0A9X1KZE3_9BACT|nr:phage major capsid protein [Fulvivirga sedimenti]MCA6078813.1 phage major capsid protein [Fulvivirga sedimenti]
MNEIELAQKLEALNKYFGDKVSQIEEKEDEWHADKQKFKQELSEVKARLNEGNFNIVGKSKVDGNKVLKAQIFDTERFQSFQAGNTGKAGFEVKAAVDHLVSGVSGGTFDMRTGIIAPESGSRSTHIRSLLPSQSGTGDSASYFTMDIATEDNTAVVAEGGLKPKSSMAATQVVVPYRKIATHAVMSDEYLMDTPALADFISSQMVVNLLKLEDRQILYGGGVAATPDEMDGLFSKATAVTDTVANVDATIWDALALGITELKSADYEEMPIILMHPTDIFKLATLRDDQARFLTESIFDGMPQILGSRIYSTTAVDADDVLIFDPSGTRFFVRDGIRVEFSNSDGDNFVENKVTIRVEERAAIVTPEAGKLRKIEGLAAFVTSLQA